MHLTVVLAVGLGSSLPMAQKQVWQSAGYVITPASSLREAIERFQAGDFDLVLLSQSISVADRERLTSRIRAAGSRVPVVCLAGSAGDYDSLADATPRDDSRELLAGIGELIAARAKRPAVENIDYRAVTIQDAA